MREGGEKISEISRDSYRVREHMRIGGPGGKRVCGLTALFITTNISHFESTSS